MATNKKKSSKKQQQQKQLIFLLILLALILLTVFLLVHFKVIDPSILFGDSEKTNSSTDNTGSDPKKPSGTPTSAELTDINMENYIKIHFIDVGQGDSILVELGTDTIMLIDAGCSTYGYKSIPKAVKEPYMAYIDKVITDHGGDIDYLIASHRDSDHINMLPGVLEKYQVNTIYINDCYQDTLTQEEIDKEKISKTLIQVETLAESEPDCDLHEFDTPDDTVIEVDGEDYKFTVYSAGNDGFDGARTKANSMSIYCLLEYGGRKVLFTGDAEVETEKWLIEKTGNDPNFDIDVVKVPHHGSTSSSCEEFLDYIHAEYGIIMSGKDNSYGLPKQVVVDRYKAHGVTLYNTQDDGTITLYIDNEGDFCFVTENSAEATE